MRLEREKRSANGVIVTVYEESTVRSQHYQNQMIRRRNVRSRKTSGGGYDRRAELLAYTDQLRRAGRQGEPMPSRRMSKSKKRRRLLAPLRNFHHSVCRLFMAKDRAWRYEKIETEEDEMKHRLYNPTRNNSWSQMSKRVCSFFKKLSSSCKCNK